MEAETDTGRQPGHLRKKGNKKRQISVRENWRAKNSHYYTELHGTIMPMQCYTCPEEEQCFFYVYTTDFFVDVTEEVMETIRAAERAEAAYERKMYRYKAQYSLDCENGIENAVLLKPQTPEMLLEEKQFQEQVYAAVMKLPEKQAKRIYARYYLGMTVNEIAEVEGVDPSRVRDSIRRGLKQLVKYF